MLIPERDAPAEAQDWDSAALARLRERYTAWSIWRSDAGRWWATRHAEITRTDRVAGAERTVDADDSVQLAAVLDQQAAIT